MAANLLEVPCPVTHDRLGRLMKGPCRIWTKALDSHGYGVLGNKDFGNTIIQRAHRVSYALAHGIPLTRIRSIPELDHLCRVPACCAPDHLDPVTHAENLRRAVHVPKSECPAGHLYDEENTGYHFRRRTNQWEYYCRKCFRDRQRAAYDPEKRRARHLAKKRMAE